MYQTNVKNRQRQGGPLLFLLTLPAFEQTKQHKTYRKDDFQLLARTYNLCLSKKTELRSAEGGYIRYVIQ